MRAAVPLAELHDFIGVIRSSKGAIGLPRALAGEVGSFELPAERGVWLLRLQLDGAGAIAGLLINEAPRDAVPVPVR